MSPALLILSLIAAAVVLVRCICMASRLSARDWAGHPLQFAGIAASYAFCAGGAVGIPLGWTPGPALLLMGVAGWVIFDRRKQIGGN